MLLSLDVPPEKHDEMWFSPRLIANSVAFICNKYLNLDAGSRSKWFDNTVPPLSVSLYNSKVFRASSGRIVLDDLVCRDLSCTGISSKKYDEWSSASQRSGIRCKRSLQEYLLDVMANVGVA